MSFAGTSYYKKLYNVVDTNDVHPVGRILKIVCPLYTGTRSTATTTTNAPNISETGTLQQAISGTDRALVALAASVAQQAVTAG